MKRFNIAMLSGIAAWVIGLTGSTAFAQAPQASSQYGYSGPAASPQAGGYPPVACHEKIGCYVIAGCRPGEVNVCASIDAELKQKFPQEPVPTAAAQVCELISELPPGDQRYVDIWRNHYIPVKVVVKPYQPQAVTAFNIRVNYREVHVLVDERGTPIPPSKVGDVLKDLQQQFASNPPAGAGTAPAAPAASSPAHSEAAPPMTSNVPAPAPNPAAAPTQAPAAQPTAAAAAAATPQKQWVWLAQEGVYGFGYQRPDGLWEIDAGSRRPTL
jgi:hypothetical protein